MKWQILFIIGSTILAILLGLVIVLGLYKAYAITPQVEPIVKVSETSTPKPTATPVITATPITPEPAESLPPALPLEPLVTETLQPEKPVEEPECEYELQPTETGYICPTENLNDPATP